MSKSPAIYLGPSPYHATDRDVGWEHVELDGEPYLKVCNVDAMPPFFMSVVGDSDMWLFVGSNGAFIAGRRSPQGAIFPYVNVDRILERPDSSGARTALLVRRRGGERSWLWEPWQPSARAYDTRRNLYKHVSGASVVFEEINLDFQLRTRWELATCREYGLVRQFRIENLGGESVEMSYLDGWHNLIPPGLSASMMAAYSYLASAYMRHDRVPGLPLGVYTLNARIVNRPEPSESLRAAVGWSLGHRDPTLLLSARQLDQFRRGGRVDAPAEVRGTAGACLVNGTVSLDGGARAEWLHVADTELDHARVARLCDELATPGELEGRVREAVANDRARLVARIAAADGLQQTADAQVSVHHFANTLYNCMRGGTFPDGYDVQSRDLADYLGSRNAEVAARHAGWLEELPEVVPLHEITALADVRGDVDLERLASEYLPLSFSRRHGDPSRPWNRFSIELRDDEGRDLFGYEGNWRDIFQNWEALAASYPGWLPNMINVFVNATTADGYNPYRITREGIDWEVPGEHDFAGHIGYWGDHQIIYLLRLLEADARYHPGRLTSELDRRGYAFVDVPYEIHDFDELVDDPRRSITFDAARHDELTRRAAEIGGDGKLLRGADGNIARATLAEKLLVPLLAKLTNLVPGGGIWLNTQRPEWNDANNALAGWGLSMVTVYYIRRYISFCQSLFDDAGDLELSAATAALLDDVTTALASHGQELHPTIVALGRAGERHRAVVYAGDLGDPVVVGSDAVRRLLATARDVVDQSIDENRRPDGLYHGYNTLELDEERATIGRLCEMLEGQVAVLSAGYLSDAEVLEVVEALRDSELYRDDQHSYLLYPDRQLPPFWERNTIPGDRAEAIPLLKRLMARGDRRLVVRDLRGDVHFQGDLRNADDVALMLDELDELDASPTDRSAVLALWEEVFDHRSFTGRSSTFFAFEGLGSIYWHMVAKLLLAVQECHHSAAPEFRAALADAYFDIRRGLGFTKTPEVFGAIPTDPYSHSPRHMGAQQPGMTGQVKEEILTRLGELGVEAREGRLRFRPSLLQRAELSAEPRPFEYIDVAGRRQTWSLPERSLAFTICQVPVAYRLGDEPSITVFCANGEEVTVDGCELDLETSRQIFARRGEVLRLLVVVPDSSFLG